MDELVHSSALIVLITNIVLSANIKSQTIYIARVAMFFKNMTDYVYSSRCAPCINVGPRGAKSRADQKQINSQIKGKSRAGLARQAKGAGIKAFPTPIASLASRVASRVRFAASSPVPARPR